MFETQKVKNRFSSYIPFFHVGSSFFLNCSHKNVKETFRIGPALVKFFLNFTRENLSLI
jgi:hypothetical protein